MNALQKQRIRDLRGNGESYAKIAAVLGISVNTIQSFCRRNNLGKGINITASNQSDGQFYCKQCGNEIIQLPGIKTRKFCSDDCCGAWWKANPDKLGKKAVYTFTCATCGVQFSAYGNKGRKYCSHACYVANRFKKAVAK
ncbi:MAG: RNA polymerase subunit sigma-70 [Turicibacter sp.]|nr:RNA polymerase subunit sigma-70 [Turicibacter sp.]